MSNGAKELSRKYIEVFDNLGWKADNYEHWGSKDFRVELEKWSPLGEDIVLDVRAKNLVDEIAEYADNFDPEEHAAELIAHRSTNGIPSSIEALLDDAYKIYDMLQELKEALQKADEERENV